MGAGDDVIQAAYTKAAKQYSDEATLMLNNAMTGKVPLNEVQSYIGTSINKLDDIPTML
jgi:hypothetical protein